jgi:hypothetical protein
MPCGKSNGFSMFQQDRALAVMSQVMLRCEPRYDNTDSNFFYDYLALLGTMQYLSHQVLAFSGILMHFVF